jgi:hypothetical protein
MAFGNEWTKTLYFTPDADNPNPRLEKVQNDNLMDYFAGVEGTGEDIQQVSIYKHSLGSLQSLKEGGLQFPMMAGLWHEFIVVESNSGKYWSFEKDMLGIRVQRGGTEEPVVKEYYRGVRRTGTVRPEGRPSQGGHRGDRILDTFRWIFNVDQLLWGYHVTERNCHHFASMLFEAIARQKNRRLN